MHGKPPFESRKAILSGARLLFMYRSSFVTSILSFIVLLAGCSGGSQTTPVNVGSSTAQAEAIATNTVTLDDPSPADPVEVDRLPAVSDAAHGRAPTIMRTALGRKTTQSVLLSMEHEEVGFLTPVDGGGTIDG